MPERPKPPKPEIPKPKDSEPEPEMAFVVPDQEPWPTTWDPKTTKRFTALLQEVGWDLRRPNEKLEAVLQDAMLDLLPEDIAKVALEAAVGTTIYAIVKVGRKIEDNYPLNDVDIMPSFVGPPLERVAQILRERK